MLIGFKRAKLQPLLADGTPDGAVIVIEGTKDEGATMEASISGLSSDPVKVYGSNIAYYVSQKGPGDVSVDLTLLDLPPEEEARILGQAKHSTLNAFYVGEETEPPYCAMTLESDDSRGDKAILGFFKGKFSKSEQALKTKEEGNFEPEGEAYTFSAVASDKAGETKGNTMIKFFGNATDAATVETLVLG